MKQFGNKKSDLGFNFIIALAIIIVFGIIYFVWLKDFRIFGENLSDYTICKNSNIENAKLRLKLDNQKLQERKGNKCKTEYVTVPKDRELEFTAKKMAICWDMYLEGKEELFETKDNNYCAICSVLTFKDKKQLNGLTNYLIENDASNLGGKNYYQYLTRTVVTNEVYREIENSHLNDLYTIDTSKPQAVIFVMGKNVNPDGLVPQSGVKIAAVTGTVGGAVAATAIAGLLIKSGVGLCLGSVFGGVTAILGCPIGSFLVIAGGITGIAAGATTGYLIGSHYNPDLDTKILLWPYSNEELSKLQCTMLEGRDRLDIKKF